jgi:hypothetical protein
MFGLHEFTPPQGRLVPPDLRSFSERVEANRENLVELQAASAELQRFRDNFGAKEATLSEAYERRIAEIQAATGVALEHPFRKALSPGALPSLRPIAQGLEYRKDEKDAFQRRLTELQREHPAAAAAIRAEIPVEQDAVEITRGAAARFRTAEEAAKTAPAISRIGREVIGGVEGGLRDEFNWYTMAVGGPLQSAARTMFGRIASRMATEAAINGGAEVIVQQRAEAWRREAGVESPDYWTSVGLAAAFGGGFGGAIQGSSEIFRVLGRSSPKLEQALARAAKDGPTAEDLRIVAEAAGAKLDDGDAASLARALEADSDNGAVREIATSRGIDERDVAAAVRAIETDGPMPRMADDVDAQVSPAQIPDNAMARPPGGVSGLKPGNMPENIAQRPSTPVAEDPRYLAFVGEQEAERQVKLVQAVRANQADLEHLKAGGVVPTLPSGRRFENIRAASDEDLAKKVSANIERKVDRDLAAIKSGKLDPQDPALQIRYANQTQPSEIISEELRASTIGEVNSAPALDAARNAVREAEGNQPSGQSAQRVSGEKGAQGNQSGAAEDAPKTSVDVMDGIPAGIDEARNPLVVTFKEMKSWAERMEEMADLVAACKVA